MRVFYDIRMIGQTAEEGLEPPTRGLRFNVPPSKTPNKTHILGTAQQQAQQLIQKTARLTPICG